MAKKIKSPFEVFFKAPLEPSDTSQIGRIEEYPNPSGKKNYLKILAPESSETTIPLYNNVKEYQDGHKKLVEDYINKHRDMFKDPKEIAEAKNDPLFFRKQLVLLCQKINESNEGYQQKPAVMTTEEFFGKSGLELLSLAEKEEAFSKAFREDSFNSPIKEIKGPASETKLMYIAGPSGSGKTSATNSVIEKILPPDATSNNINYVITLDGANLRERSFVYQLAIKTAERKNCMGLSDLHKVCKGLDSVKNDLNETAFRIKGLNIIIPDTFSKIYKKIPAFIGSIMRSERQPIFCRVTADPECVKKMGTDRAYKQEPDTLQKEKDEIHDQLYSLGAELQKHSSALIQSAPSSENPKQKACEALKKHLENINTSSVADLQELKKGITEFYENYPKTEAPQKINETLDKIQQNIEKIVTIPIHEKATHESKKYQSSGFLFGEIGSQIAEAIFKSITGKTTTILDKDLILLRKDDKNPGEWVRTNYTNSGELLISKTLFEEWNSLNSEQKRDMPLEDFRKAKGLQGPKVMDAPDNPLFQSIALILLKAALSLQHKKDAKLAKKLEHSQDPELLEKKQKSERMLEGMNQATTSLQQQLSTVATDTKQTLIELYRQAASDLGMMPKYTAELVKADPKTMQPSEDTPLPTETSEKMRSNSNILDTSQIDMSSKKLSGGKTGSVRVSIDGENYQYKPSILDNKSIIRKVKSDFTDSENFGELLASRIAKVFDTHQDTLQRVPDVAFIVDKDSANVAVGSKYLTGDQVASLDAYLDKDGTQKGSDIKLVSGDDNPKLGHFNLEKSGLKKELANAIALSALVGDHDVNHGNMMVITKDGQTRIGRIDYGHAFNDLLRHPKFGGGTVHENPVIDFFNRSTVDGINAKSKLWRYYPGLIPSQEMADALKQIANDANGLHGIKDAIARVKNEVTELIESNPQVDKNQVIKSFARISEHVSGEKIAPSASQDEQLNKIFDTIENYVDNNLKKMSYAGQVMSLQVEIKDALVNKKESCVLESLKEHHATLIGNTNDGPFSWIKESANLPAFKGNFTEFVEHTKKIIQLEQMAQKLQEHANSDDNAMSKSAKSILGIINNPKHSVEKKITLLETKMEHLELAEHNRILVEVHQRIFSPMPSEGNKNIPVKMGSLSTNTLKSEVDITSRMMEGSKINISFDHPPAIQLATKTYKTFSQDSFYKGREPVQESGNAVTLSFKNQDDQYQYLTKLATEVQNVQIKDPKTDRVIAVINDKGQLCKTDGTALTSSAEYANHRREQATVTQPTETVQKNLNITR